MNRHGRVVVGSVLLTALLAVAFGLLVSAKLAQADSDGKDGKAAEGEIKLTKVDYSKMVKAIADNKKAKYTLVDAWATWCTPCMENFPHVVEMHKKFSKKGLAVCSLSMDEEEDSEKVLKFLRKEKAVFTNFLAAKSDDLFDALKVQAIPAVFVFGPDGKEIKRFTMDDVKNQFTYDQVEKYVESLVNEK